MPLPAKDSELGSAARTASPTVKVRCGANGIAGTHSVMSLQSDDVIDAIASKWLRPVSTHGARRRADGAARVEILQQHRALGARPRVDAWRARRAVVVAEIGPADVVGQQEEEGGASGIEWLLATAGGVENLVVRAANAKVITTAALDQLGVARWRAPASPRAPQRRLTSREEIVSSTTADKPPS